MKNLFLILLAPFAAAAGPLTVQTVAQLEQVVTLADGSERTELVAVTTIVPGDEVVYTITFANDGEAPAEAVTITDPVPTQMRYVAGSAFGPGTDVSFSVDGGATFGAPDELSVTGDDGEVRPATAADYTHIRWQMRHPIAAGKRGFARFKAALR